MADWTRGMARTYEYWRVDPSTWGDTERIDTITGATIVRDADLETLGSASFEMDAWEGEMYVRTYLVTYQDGVRERWPIGTHLLIADSQDFDGMRGSSTVEGYTPLKELIDDKPPLGFTVSPLLNTHDVETLLRNHARMPLSGGMQAFSMTEDYTADPDSETWLSLISGCLARGKQKLDIDTLGRALIVPEQSAASLAPAYTFDDGNSSILQPAVSVGSNMPEVPNVVEVVYSNDSTSMSSVVVNQSKASMVSTVGRGRIVRLRETSPELPDNPVQIDVDEAARKLMKEKGSATYEVRFTHGYLPSIMPGMAVRLDYRAMGLDAVAVIASQTIRCTPSCQVECVARFTKEESWA